MREEIIEQINDILENYGLHISWLLEMSEDEMTDSLRHLPCSSYFAVINLALELRDINNSIDLSDI